jgi:hypothetical protein
MRNCGSVKADYWAAYLVACCWLAFGGKADEDEAEEGGVMLGLGSVMWRCSVIVHDPTEVGPCQVLYLVESRM